MSGINQIVEKAILNEILVIISIFVYFAHDDGKHGG